MKKTKKEVVQQLQQELKKEAEETGGIKLDLTEIEGKLTEVEETGTPKPKEEKSTWYWIFEIIKFIFTLGVSTYFKKKKE